MPTLAELLEPTVVEQLKTIEPVDEPVEIEIDPRSEAMIVVGCSQCPASVVIDPTITTAEVRTPVCIDCAKELIGDKPVQIIHSKETPMFDVDNLSDAELGALVRQRIKATKTDQIVAATPAVVAERAKAEAEQATHVAERQAERSGQVLPGFTVGKVEVPALDLSVLTDLNEAPAAKVRSPYNKVRHARGEDLLDPETTTYAVLAEDHARLSPKAKKKGKKVVLAVTEPDEEIKAKELAKILDISVKKARKLVSA